MPRAISHLLSNGPRDHPSLVVVAATGPPAAVHDLRAAVDSVLQLGLDLGALRRGVHRSHPAVLVEALARLELRRPADELPDQAVVYAFLSIESSHGAAPLRAVGAP